MRTLRLLGDVKTCQHCAKEVYVPHYRLNLFKYCSRSCGALAVRIHGSKPCGVCGKIFNFISSRSNTAKYCSRLCYHRSQTGRGLTEFQCQYCKRTFRDSASIKRKFCSKACVNKSEKSTWHPCFTTVRKKMLSLNLINECFKCSYNEVKSILGVHHIDQNRTNNDVSNLMVLCPNCHSLEHNKHISH